jgi:hypothetical protein
MNSLVYSREVGALARSSRPLNRPHYRGLLRRRQGGKGSGVGSNRWFRKNKELESSSFLKKRTKRLLSGRLRRFLLS